MTHALLYPTVYDEAATENAVSMLSRSQHRVRLDGLMAMADEIVRTAWERHGQGTHRLVGKVVLFSGGNDSTVLLHLMRRQGHVDYTGHANTTIGVEDTRQFVRDVSAAWGVPLIEKYPPQTYRELVLKMGFPGPAQHYRAYQQLKERCLRLIRRELVTDPRTERVLYIAGRRRAESERRADIPLDERTGSTVWASPLAMWTKHDLVFYRAVMAEAGDPVPFNPVTDKLGMSGECLCGAFAKPDELERIRFWYPDLAADIDALQAEVAATGQRACVWGQRPPGRRSAPTSKTGPMCTSCTTPV